MKTPTITIVCEPTNGLCNRLRAIASGYVLASFLNASFLNASFLNYDFYIEWNPTADIGYTNFSDLFTNSELLYHSNMEKSNINKLQIIKLQISKYYTENDAILDILTNIQNTQNNTQNNIVFWIANCGGNFKHPEMTIEQYNTTKTEFYKSLRPIISIEQTINNLCKNLIDGSIMGVQIRRTDRKFITPSTEKFAKKILQLIENQTYENQNKKNKKIFVCSDDPNEFLLLKNLLPPWIEITHYPLDNYDRNSPKNIQNALIDWYLLAHCNIILYSANSSFGYEACIMSKALGFFQNGYEMRKSLNSIKERKNLFPLLF